MERDVSLLRCSKLSCYSEFNRMVQAIARNGGEGAITTIPGTKLQKGTSAEYNFYATLILMLKQVISNTDSVIQKRELQRVYEWFCLNKPLIKSKTKPTQRKPKLSITTTSDKSEAAVAVPFPFPELDRPQTAPASLYKIHRFSYEDTRIDSSSGRGNSSPPRRRPTFTAMYVSRSLSRGMDLIGQPLDQLQLQQKQTTVHTRSQERISSPEERVDVSNAVDNSTPTKESKGSTINVIDFPSSDFLTHQSPGGQRPGTSESPISVGAVFSMVPGVAAQMILERELNEHYQTNRKRALSLHTAQMLRIGGDYQPNHRLVTTPTDIATVEPFHLKRYSVTDSTNTSERLKQRRADPNDSSPSKQASPRHQERAEVKDKEQTDSENHQSAIRSGHDATNTTDQSSNLVQNQAEKYSHPSTSPPEVQEMMLDMKAVDSRTSILSLSQVSLKQRDSPRAKRKQNNHDDATSHLQIEGQSMKFSSEAARQSPRFVSTATQREHRVNSPKSSTRLVHETKSGSLTSLIIRPVSLQHHSGRVGVTPCAVNQEQKGDEKPELGGDVDTEEAKDMVAPGNQDGGTVASDTNHVNEETETKIPVSNDSLTDEKDLQTKSQEHDKGDSPDKMEMITESESQNIVEDKSAPASSQGNNQSLVDKKPKDGAVDTLQRDELPTNAAAVAITTELVETNSSVSQDIPVSSEMPKSPVVMVKTSLTPVRPYSNRPSSSSRKSRLPSPMNVVSLSFPSDKIGERHSMNRHTTAVEAARKPPTIIAGFNKKRYYRLKSSPAAS